MGEAEISIRDVTFSYDGRQDVFRNFNLDIPKGKCVALKAEAGKRQICLPLFGLKSDFIFCAMRKQQSVC